MQGLIGSILVSTALVAGCGNGDDEAAQVDAFCNQFTNPAAGGIIGTTTTSLPDALLFFRQLDEVAPPEISTQISTVVDGLESIVDAFAQFQGEKGEEAIDAVLEASEVDIDALNQAALEIEQFALENCDG